MKIIHTSPECIEKIHEYGLLGENLCFSGDVYVMTAKADYVTYTLDIDEENIIDVRELYDQEIVKEIAERLNVDEDTAERLLDNRESSWDYGGDADDNWWIQGKQGDCTKKMGFEAVESTDEQGTV